MLLKDGQDSPRGRLHLLHVIPDQGLAALPDLLQVFLGIRRILVHVIFADGLGVIRRLEAPGHRLEGRLQIEAVPLFQAGLHVVREPVQQAVVLLGQTVQDPVYALLHQRILVQLYLVGGELADLAGERPKGLLEELVDGGHGEGRVVVQDGA